MGWAVAFFNGSVSQCPRRVGRLAPPMLPQPRMNGARTEARRALSVAQVNTEMGFSGGEVQMFLMMEGLRQLGHRCIVFCQPGSRSAAVALERDFEAVHVRMRNDSHLGAIFALTRAFRRSRLDLVHLHTGRANWLAGWAARAASLPALTTRRMDRRLRRGLRTRLIYRSLTRRAVAISPAVAEHLRQAEVPSERIRMVYEAVDPERVQGSNSREQVRRQLGAGPSEPLLLSLAALIPRKGLDVVIDALGLLASDGWQPRFYIAGEGPERDSLEKRVARVGVAHQVVFLGRRDDSADLLAACDVFVLASRREGLGVAALEAMAAGRPVVCSRVGGLAHSVVHERTGLLVPPGQPRALAQALARLLPDAELRQRLGSAGPLRIAEGFLAEQMVSGYAQLYNEVLSEWESGH